ncbi:MAG: tRNA (N(6)-L-threonylcarbamoyladenosine(37)-C(2))-methylthiotransferase MtaB, partial [Sphingomonadaceae bacterium]|nr:tRNA (N(6)-L-threonylcarbamoyladenosine(37)-C(2))-methylthiotransferase MtaB [Sphingomonadaceae bacterium]
PYSPRPGTPAARMPQTGRATVKQRAADLRGDVAAVRTRWLDGLRGQSMDVLAERDGTGYAPNFARIALPEGTPAGSIVTITPQTVEEGLLK